MMVYTKKVQQFRTAEACLDHCKEVHGLDLPLLKGHHNIDTFSYIRSINYSLGENGCEIDSSRELNDQIANPRNVFSRSENPPGKVQREDDKGGAGEGGPAEGRHGGND